MQPRALALPSLALLLVYPIGDAAFSTLRADERTAADLLPATTVLYAEIAAPGDLADAVRNHPLRKTLEAMPEYKQLTDENPDYLKALAGVGIFEFVAKRKWHEAVGDAAGGGLFLGVDARTQGALALARAPDEGALKTLHDRLLQAVRDDAKRKGQDVPFEEGEYRGHKIYTTEQAVWGIFGPWLIIANKPELGRAVADNLLDGGTDTLAKRSGFAAARQSLAGKPAAWAYADVQALREAGLTKEIDKEKNDNPGAEWLLGGVLAVLKDASTATAAVYLEDEQLHLAVSVPHDPAAIPESKEFFFGKDGRGAAPAALSPGGRLLAVSLYRDAGEMWRRRSDLFDETANAGLVQADSGLSALFAGMDFGREVLGALEPQVQIILAAQDFEAREKRVPAIKLPAAALVLQLKEPEKMRRQLKVSFQSMVGLANIGAGQAQLPQLELKTERIDGGELVSATYESLEDEEVSNDIIFNFSPSLAFEGKHFIVSSTRELAVELMVLAKREAGPEAAEGEGVVNTHVAVHSGVLRKLLQDNREPLIAQNMLEKGHPRRQAEREIGELLALSKLLGDVSLELSTHSRALRLDLAVGFARTADEAAEDE